MDGWPDKRIRLMGCRYVGVWWGSEWATKTSKLGPKVGVSESVLAKVVRREIIMAFQLFPTLQSVLHFLLLCYLYRSLNLVPVGESV